MTKSEFFIKYRSCVGKISSEAFLSKLPRSGENILHYNKWITEFQTVTQRLYSRILASYSSGEKKEAIQLELRKQCPELSDTAVKALYDYAEWCVAKG